MLVKNILQTLSQKVKIFDKSKICIKFLDLPRLKDHTYTKETHLGGT